MSARKYGTTGNLSGASGTAFSGTAVQPDMSTGGSNRPRPGTLCAEVDVTAATSSLAVYLKWQVSHDNSTWIDVLNGPQNPAAVALVTGTASKITRAVEAPAAVYGYSYARAVLYSGGATGSAGDAVGVGYNWSKPIAAY